MPTVSVIVCTYNRCESLRKTLEALRTQVVSEGLSLEILVVDNNSADRTREIVRESSRASRWPMRYLFEPTQGKSYALNQGIREAVGEFVAFADDDERPESNWVQALHEAFLTHNADCVGGKILPEWEQEPPAWLRARPKLWTHLGILDRGDEVHQVRVGQGGWVWGGNCAFRRSIFSRIGVYRTDLGPVGTRRVGGEDGEMVRRAALHGGTVIYQPAAVVYHRIGPERMRLSHFRRVRFYEGLTRRRFPGSRSDVARLPRWLFRSCASHGLKAFGLLATGRAEASIEEELSFWAELGLIVGGLRPSPVGAATGAAQA
jgi:glycosyltransferase involved in cell wall biosynthesis